MPELKELTRDESRELAKEVLGSDFEAFAPHLAEIGSNSPLVIVAGGRLIASRKINPSTLTTIDEFRSTIFDWLLADMNLKGAHFPIDPPCGYKCFISSRLSDRSTSKPMISRSQRERSSTSPSTRFLGSIDELASVGIVTPRSKPVRIIPDVLSDYLLEDHCINSVGRSTLYADRVYKHFGSHSLQNLMRNLSELDWRRGLSGETGLNLLNSIWADIHQRFRAGDEYIRKDILADSGRSRHLPACPRNLTRPICNRSPYQHRTGQQRESLQNRPFRITSWPLCHSFSRLRLIIWTADESR